MRLLLLFLPLLLIRHSQQDEHELIKRDNDWQMPDDYYKNWKCTSNMPGRQTSNYRDLVKGECADLKDRLNQCCVDFNACSGVRCVENHEECNTKVISGRETQCFSIADRLVQKELRHFPDNDWKCRPPMNRLGGWEQNYRDLIRSVFCSHLKDSLNQCCADFNNCSGVKCIADHKKCNSQAILGLEQQCSAIADKFVQEEKGHFMPETWKCSSPLLGGAENTYQTLVKGACANLKDSLNECCVTFKKCHSNKGRFCVDDHEQCNTKAISGRESECSEIADKLVRKDLRQTPDKDWKCIPPFGRLGGQDYDYRALVSNIHCSHLKDRLNQCCVDFNNCHGMNCVENHEECNAKVVSGSEIQCFAIADKFVSKEQRYFPDKDWECKAPFGRWGGKTADWQSLRRDITCSHLKDGLNKCCMDFNICSKERKCVENHEQCNANVIKGKEEQCSAIANRFIAQEKRDSPDKNWKCIGENMPGVRDGVYHHLVNSMQCVNLKDRLNQCCIDFETCYSARGLLCVEEHEACNKEVVTGSHLECSEIADELVRKELRTFPEKDWHCRPPLGKLGGQDQYYRELIQNIYCSPLKDKLNQCCAEFNNCKGVNCVEIHEQCNAEVVKDQARECAVIANKFIAHEQRFFPDKDWKCVGNNEPGTRNGVYRHLVKSIHCFSLKDRLNQCCVNFEKCHSNKGRFCVEEHEECNKIVVAGSNLECSEIAEKLIRNDLRVSPDKDWKCSPPFGKLGGQDQYYRELIQNIYCSPLKDKLNQCCADFNKCSGVNCVENHEKCNAVVIRGNEKHCSAIANKFISQEKRHRPDQDWKCTGNGIPGARDGIYHKIMNSLHCAPLKDKISQCCANFNTCSDKKGTDCIVRHKICNEQVVHGSEKECSALVDSLVMKEDTKKEVEKSTNVLIIYYNRVILYSKDQLATHPIRTWVVFVLIAVLSVLFLLSIGCFCCTVLSKKNDETMIYHQSSSRVASSVRSNSGRN